ncbi:hypothetical protein [Sulfurovum sp.]|uniref:hypothetical protein n=1 Tax=Sulfurovum sp. TaxID=1969726 RepID=UPI0028682FF7|nr:hypothetical protein [Sulfurovum sp.]
MNNNNLLGFALGAAITGIGTYYAIKNKDEILNKINDIEEMLTDDYKELVSKSKEKLEDITKTVQSTVQGFLQHGGTIDAAIESEFKLLVKKLDKLQKEIESFSVKS